MLFYKGQGDKPLTAIQEALSHCASILEQNPALIIELLELNHGGTHWEAHIRLMAIEVSGATGVERKSKASDPPEKEYAPKSPEHFRSGNPFEWRPIGMDRELVNPLGTFDQAAYGGGYIPDIPTQDIEILKRAGWSSLDIRTRMVTDNQDVLSTLHIIDPEPK